ncbi:hypothetical protein ACFQ0G_25070 [Streptomyces chiangmaiensis]
MTHASTIPAACEGEPGDRDRVRPAGGGRRLRTSARAALGLFVTAPGGGFFESEPRFLLPAFPLLIVAARAPVRTARARPWHAPWW